MNKTPWIAGAALAATLAAVGAYAMPDGPPKTRAEVQARVAEHFKKIDANNDGFVTQAEFDAVRDKMHARFAERREEHRERAFAMLDKDRNGSLSKEEFMAPPPRGEHMGDHEDHDGPGGPGGPGGEHDGRHRHGRHGMMRHGMGMAMGGEWFARADVNHDGKVSLAEATATATAMFDRVDTNHDGTISPEEHEAARAAMRAKWQDHRGEDAAPKG